MEHRPDAVTSSAATGDAEPRPLAAAVSASQEPARRLRALAHPARLALNRTLQARGGAPTAVPELAEAVGLPIRTARRHLRILTENGIVAAHGGDQATHYTPVAATSRELAHSVHTPLTPQSDLPPTGSGTRADPRLQLLSRVAEQVGDGVALIDADGWLIYANPAFSTMHGYGEADLAGQHFTAFYPAQGQQEVLAQLIADAREHGVGRAETWRLRQDRSLFPAAVTLSLLRDDAGELLGRVLSVQDITTRRNLEDRLREQALHDPLTGLPNRRLLLDRLDALSKGSQRSARSLAVIFCDLDGFKQVNDQHGHDVGDHLLIAVARRLAFCLRPEDTLARLGGDEFVVLLPGADRTDARGIADRLRSALDEPLAVGGQLLAVELSIGITTGPTGRAQALLSAADAAMYRDKAIRRQRAGLLPVRLTP